MVTLTYAEEGAAAWAESTLGQVVEAYGHGSNPRTAWIGGAKIDRQGRSITLRVALPPRLLEELPAVDATDIGLDLGVRPGGLEGKRNAGQYPLTGGNRAG